MYEYFRETLCMYENVNGRYNTEAGLRRGQTVEKITVRILSNRRIFDLRQRLLTLEWRTLMAHRGTETTSCRSKIDFPYVISWKSSDVVSVRINFSMLEYVHIVLITTLIMLQVNIFVYCHVIHVYSFALKLFC